MSATRLATIPFDHLEAELAAFPIASEASFRLGITTLNAQVSHADNDQLWRAAERVVLNALPSVPQDEAVTIRDMLWFDSCGLAQDEPNLEQRVSRSVSLREYLQRLASGYLELDGKPKVLTPRANEDTESQRARLRWSWMCQALPPDLLRMARNVGGPAGDPFLPDDDIREILDHGFAETHLHLGAALDFPLAWAALMRALTKNDSRHSDFESPGGCFDNGRILSSWLLHAAVVRLVLADWLFSGSPQESSLREILTFACNRPGRRLNVTERHRLGALLDEVAQGKGFDSPQLRLATGYGDHLKRRFPQTRSLYRQLIGPPPLFRTRTGRQSQKEIQGENGVFGSDPLSSVVGWLPAEGTSPETSFTSRALEYLEGVDREESDFARLFWQLIRIRCLLYRHVVQRPLTPGLQWFVRFFSRIKPLRENISKTVRVSAAARLSGVGVGLASLEVRLGTEESESLCLQKVRVLEQAALPKSTARTFRFFRHRLKKEKHEGDQNEKPNFEVGALFHFSRKRGGGWERGKPNAYGLDHSYPGMLRTRPVIEQVGNPTGFRFARFYLEQRRHAQALVSLFEKYPQALYTFRGIDLCTDEAGVPVWVMAPLVRWVQKAGQKAEAHLERRGEAKQLEGRLAAPIRFRTSVHAGEDFVHLLTGLRRLDEAINNLGLKNNDRLGHALALGVDPSVWCRRVARVIQAREERLFDLIWEWSWYLGKHRPKGYLKNEITRLAGSIFGSIDGASYTPEDLVEFIKLLHDQEALKDQGFPSRPALRARHSRLLAEYDGNRKESKFRARILLIAYLSDEAVWQRGRIPEEIDVLSDRHERAALCGLQHTLRMKVKSQSLTIEVNPSSNLLVGDLGNFMGHPLWRLRPVTRWSRFRNRPTLRICVGSDDPMTFATRLRHEYQLLCDAIILKGYNRKVAMKWIEGVRKIGIDSKFTLTRNLEQISNGLRVPSLLKWDRPEVPP
jgi:hypothetical protein